MTGLKASTLFRAYQGARKSRRYWERQSKDFATFADLPFVGNIQAIAEKYRRQEEYFGNKLTEKLEAQKKELEELRSKKTMI